MNDRFSASQELVNRYIAAYNAFDIAGMMETLHPAVTFQNTSAGQVTATATGAAEFRRLAEHAAELFAHRRQTIHSLQHDGDCVVVCISFEGTLARDLPGGPAAGHTLRLTGRSTFTFRDDLIASVIDES